MEQSDIISKIRCTYNELHAYRDTGFLSNSLNAGAFRTAFVRPNNFLYEFKSERRPEAHALWSNGGSTHLYQYVGRLQPGIPFKHRFDNLPQAFRTLGELGITCHISALLSPEFNKADMFNNKFELLSHDQPLLSCECMPWAKLQLKLGGNYEKVTRIEIDTCDIEPYSRHSDRNTITIYEQIEFNGDVDVRLFNTPNTDVLLPV